MARGVTIFRLNGTDYIVNDGNNALEFRTDTNYKYGDIVNYEGGLNRFITDHSAGAWNASHVEAVSFAGMMKGIYASETINALVWFYNNYKPTFAAGADNAIVVTFPQDSPNNPPVTISLLKDGKIDNNKYFNNTQNSITVADNSTLLYDMESELFVTKSGNADDLSSSRYAYCFHNYRGKMYGQWARYDERVQTEQRMTQQGVVGFANNNSPTFARDSSGNITVTFPSESVMIAYPKSFEKYQGWIYKTRTQTSITVAPGQTLIYDIDNEVFAAKNGQTFDVVPNMIICFLNFKGKIYGPWSEYETDKRLSLLETANADILPSYYDTHMVTQINALNTKLIAAPAGDAFIFITDIHSDGNAMKSPAMIKKILQETSIDKVMLNGDYINQEATKAAALDKINKVINLYRYVGAETYTDVGNHEYNTNGSVSGAPELTWQELYYPIMKRQENKVVRQSNGLGFYWLNEAQKIKYMYATFNKDAGMETNSCRFILNNLTNTPSGYTIVFINHGGIRNDLTYQSGFDEIVAALEAIRTNGTYTDPGTGTTYDFTNADYTVACAITGHYHRDFSTVTESGMPIISVTCDAYAYNDDSGVTRTQGTVSEQAFDAFVIDTTSHTVETVRFGGGSSRSFTY